MDDPTYIDFENYLAGEMPAAERPDFEQKLQKDAALRAKFELYQQTSQFLAVKFSTETAAFKQNLQKISGEYFSENKAKKTKVIQFKPWQYAVAASVAVLFGILFFNQDNPQYSDFNQHETAAFTERGTADAQLKKAQDFFNAKDYPKAVSAFEKIPNPDNPELQYYYAIALIETGSYAKAEGLLSKLRDGGSVYKDKAIWYLALSNLKQNKLETCKSYLKQIPAHAEEYQKARELLDDLD